MIRPNPTPERKKNPSSIKKLVKGRPKKKRLIAKMLAEKQRMNFALFSVHNTEIIMQPAKKPLERIETGKAIWLIESLNDKAIGMSKGAMELTKIPTNRLIPYEIASMYA